MENDLQTSAAHMEDANSTAWAMPSTHLPHTKRQKRPQKLGSIKTNLVDQHMDKSNRQNHLQKTPIPHRTQQNYITKPSWFPKIPLMTNIGLRNGTTNTNSKTQQWESPRMIYWPSKSLWQHQKKLTVPTAEEIRIPSGCSCSTARNVC